MAEIPNHCILEAERIYRDSLGYPFTKVVMTIAEAIAKAEQRGLDAAARFLEECNDHGDKAKAEAIRAMKGGDGNGNA